MTPNEQWNDARLKRHKAEHNVEEAKAALFLAEQKLRQARQEVRCVEAYAFAEKEVLTPWPLPSFPMGQVAR